MIIPAQEIRRRGIFTPFHERTVIRGKSFGLSSAGYDVRIDEIGEKNPAFPFLKTGFDADRGDYYLMQPGEFILASTVERFDMPNDLIGIVHDKSTWVRQGLTVQNTVIEPGWRGVLTLELTNHSKQHIPIFKGDPIAQIVLHLLTEPTEQGYSGKYQDQAAGPQAARFEGVKA